MLTLNGAANDGTFLRRKRRAHAKSAPGFSCSHTLSSPSGTPTRPGRIRLTVGTGQEETVDASRPVRDHEGQPSDVWGPARTGELVGGKYRISRFLAEGGMGVVYEAQHAIVKRRFAVKFLRSDYARRRENLARFQREAEAAGGLENEHIASVVDFGITADGSPYIVMEYLAGESLASLLKREGNLPVGRAADLCAQACHGAEAAHAAGIIHRDLKPQNVFVCRREDGTDLLKILDFGIAKLEPIKHDEVSTETGAVLGTPAYMSPEQARGERAIDVRTDVYSLGAILFEMLSGRLPHPGDSPNAALYHISTQPAVSLAAVAPELPKPLVEIVDRALASDPGVRLQSAKAFAGELAPFAKRAVWPEAPRRLTPPNLPVGDVFTPRKAPSAAPASPAPDPGLAKAMDVRPDGRHPARVRIIVVAAAVALVAAAGVVSSRLLKPAATSRGEPAEPAGSAHPLMDVQRPTSGAGIPVIPEAAPRLVETASIPAPPLDVDKTTAARSDAASRTPAKALATQPARAVGRPIGRPSVTSAESIRDGLRPGAPKASSPAGKHSFPRATFDPDNPYGRP